MRRFVIMLAIICACGLLSVACDVASTNPVASSGQAGNIPDILLGAWTVEKIAQGLPATIVTVTVSRAEDGSLLALVRDGSDSKQETVLLSNIGSRWVVSHKTEFGSWAFYEIEIDTNEQRMKIRNPDSAALKRDIQGGVIAGEISSLDPGDDAIQLTASSEALRAYLETRPELFSKVMVELKKSAP